MKLSLAPLTCAALLVAGLVTGCDTAPAHAPRSTRTFVLSTEHPSPDVEIAPVEAIHVILPGPLPGSELVWEIVSNNNKVLDQMGPLKPVAASEAISQAPSTEVSFYAMRTGKSVLRFFLINPRLKEAVPVAKCQLTVRVIEN